MISFMVLELFIGSELWAEVRITNSSIKDVDSHQKIQNKYGFKMVNSFWTTHVKRSFSASQWNHTRLVWAPRSSSSAALIRWGNPYGSVLWVHRDVCSRGVFCFSVLSYDLKTVSIYFWTLEDGLKRSDALHTSLLYMEVQKHESAECQ